jgi:hypothetical protein
MDDSQMDAWQLEALQQDEPLLIAGRRFRSRLMIGTGKYPSLPSMQASLQACACEIVTVAVRRVQSLAAGHEGLMEAIDWQRIWMLPNTAGCATAEEAVRVARLGRELAKLAGQEDNTFVKLEVIPDPRHLLPDPIGTLEAAEQLVKEGFTVLPYINADPLLARRLEEVGCATVMPLGPGPSQHRQYRADHRERPGAGGGGRGHRRPERGGSGHGAGRRRAAGEQCDRARRPSSRHGPGHGEGLRGRASSLPRRAAADPPRCQPQLSPRWSGRDLTHPREEACRSRSHLWLLPISCGPRRRPDAGD